MLADIEAGKVATVIVKDMSRLGRNYLQVGMYTAVSYTHLIEVCNLHLRAFPVVVGESPFLHGRIGKSPAFQVLHGVKVDVYKRQVSGVTTAFPPKNRT